MCSIVDNKERITGWRPKKLENNNFEEAIEKAMKETHISLKRAIVELTVYICANGDTEDFRNFINFLIEYQKKIESEENYGKK